MKKYLIIYLFFFLCLNVFGQKADSVSTVIDSAIYKDADVLPRFPGGDSSLAAFIVNNFNYPKRALDVNLVSDVISVSFIISFEGKVKNIKIIQGSEKAPSLDAEIVRVLSQSPDWKPAKRNGMPVNFIYFLHISPFKSSGMLEIRVYNVSVMNHQRAKQNREYNIGVNLSKEGNYAGAIDHFTNAININPQDIDALYNRGIMKIKLNDINGACIDFNTIRSLDSSDADVLLKKYCSK